jgi:antitoxin ParD1/3/4
MTITLSPELESFIKTQLDSGAYSSASEVVSKALKLLEERERKVQLLRADIQKGLDQLDRGEYSTLTMDDIKKLAREKALSGKS